MKVSFDGKFLTMIAEDDQDIDVFKQIKAFQDKEAEENNFWHFECFDLSEQHFSMKPGNDQILLAVQYI